MAVRSKTTIFNAALLRTGNHSYGSGGSSGIEEALDANYDEIVREAFENTEFTFGKARVMLTSRSAGDFGFDDAFLLPADLIHVTEVYFNDYAAPDIGEKWEIDGSTSELMVDAKERSVAVEYLKVGLEHTWSASFARGIQRKLEAVIKDVIEESEEAAALDNEGDFQIMKGSVKSAKNRSNNSAWKNNGRLIRAHRRR